MPRARILRKARSTIAGLTAPAPPRFDLAALPVLPRSFFNRDPRQVGPDLLGKILVRRERGHILAGRIVEAEAYLGISDPAAHAAAGKTSRNAVLFGPPGHAYVYFIYGNHYCLNISCMPEGDAGCVLLRALEPLAGIEFMAANRDLAIEKPSHLRVLTSGPGRMAEALAITRERDNGKDLLGAKSDLQILDDGFVPDRVLATPRIGITKAAENLLRYVVAGNRFVSGRKIG
jgi:DNA-3-methyladenine glycosylase